MRSVFFSLALALLFVMVMAGGGEAQTLWATDGRSCTPSTLYQLDPTDGSIVATVGSTVVSGLTGLAAHPGTGVLYAVSTGGPGGGSKDGSKQQSCTANLYTLDATTGAATLVGPLGEPRSKPDMAFDAAGTLYTITPIDPNDPMKGGAGDATLGTVNLMTGDMSLIGATGIMVHDIGLTFSAGGSLIMTDQNDVFTVNTSTGLATMVASMSEETSDTNMMTTHPTTGDIYIADSGGGVPVKSPEKGEPQVATLLYILDPATGAMTLLGSNDNGNLCAIAFAPLQEERAIPTTQGWGVGLLGLLIAISALIAIRRR